MNPNPNDEISIMAFDGSEDTIVEVETDEVDLDERERNALEA